MANNPRIEFHTGLRLPSSRHGRSGRLVCQPPQQFSVACVRAFGIAIAVGMSNPSWADAASDKAEVDLQQAKVNLLKSQIPAAPDKTLTPSVPAAPALNATADKNVNFLANQVAFTIASQISLATENASARSFAFEDGKTRASIGVYKSVVTAIGTSTDTIVSRTEVLKRAVASLSTNQRSEYVAPLVIAGIAEAAIGFAELFKTQYSFATTSQKDQADAAVATAVAQVLKSKGYDVLDLSMTMTPCIDADLLARWQIDNPLVCKPDAGKPSILSALTRKLFAATKSANDQLVIAAASISSKDPADARTKSVASTAQALQTSLDDATKMIATLNASDAGGNAAFDIAQRTEPLMMMMNVGSLYFISTKAIAMDSDVIVDTRWYSPLEVSMESVLLAQWQLNDSKGVLLARRLECVASGRRLIPLRVGGSPAEERRTAALTCA